MKFTAAFWKATGERMVRGAIAALVAAYLSGNLVFDTTNVKFTLGRVLALAVGGAVSALAISLGVQAKKKNGPALTGAEVLNPPTPVEPSQRGAVSLVGVLVVVLLVLLILFLLGAVR